MPSHYEATFRFVDREKNTADSRIKLSAVRYTWSTALSFAEVLAARMQAVSDCVLLNYKVAYVVKFDSFSTPGVLSDVTRTGVFVVSLADGHYTYVLVPGIKEELIERDGQGLSVFTLNEDDARVQDLKALFPFMTDEYGNQIEALVIAGVSQ